MRSKEIVLRQIKALCEDAREKLETDRSFRLRVLLEMMIVELDRETAEIDAAQPDKSLTLASS